MIIALKVKKQKNTNLAKHESYITTMVFQLNMRLLNPIYYYVIFTLDNFPLKFYKFHQILFAIIIMHNNIYAKLI